MVVLATNLISAYLPVGAQGIQGTTGNNGVLSWSTKTSNYTAVPNEAIMAVTTGGTFTITLPSAPAIGNIVAIGDGGNFAANPLIVSGSGGKLIEGYDTFTLDIQHVKVDFVYDGTGWQTFSTMTAGGGNMPITVSTIAPTGPAVGDLWVDTN